MLSKFSKDFSIVLGIVFIWRGIWYVLDYLDQWIFGGSHFFTAVLAVVIGLLLLYLPDHNFKELERL